MCTNTFTCAGPILSVLQTKSVLLTVAENRFVLHQHVNTLLPSGLLCSPAARSAEVGVPGSMLTGQHLTGQAVCEYCLTR